jgi:hypothetical protein
MRLRCVVPLRSDLKSMYLPSGVYSGPSSSVPGDALIRLRKCVVADPDLPHPTTYLVAPGGFVDEMTTGQGIAIAGQPRVEFGSNRDWVGGMLTHCWGEFDALATHAYPPENKRFDLGTGQLFDVEQPLEEWARQPL